MPTHSHLIKVQAAFPVRPDSRIVRKSPALKQWGVRASGFSSVSHVSLFLIGWGYYLAVPLGAGFLGLFEATEQALPFAARFDAHNSRWTALIIYVLLMPLAYLFGDRFARKIRARRFATIAAIGRTSWILLFVYVLLLFSFTLQARALLFGGYVEGYDPSLMGPLATVEMVLLFQYIVCRSAGDRLFTFAFGTLLALASLVLLSMGGRIYVASAVAAIFFYQWKWVSKTSADRAKIAKWIVIAPFALAALGMLRLGTFDVRSFGFFLFAEPLFTSISGISFVLDDAWHWFATPQEFIGSFINIIPSAIWPDKVSHLVSLSDIYGEFESPFGAQSIVTSTIGNFGYIGGLMFVTLVGFIMGRCAKNVASPTSHALYCYLVSLLPFIFFRDPYQIQVKLVITGFLLSYLHRAIGGRKTGYSAPSPGVGNI